MLGQCFDNVTEIDEVVLTMLLKLMLIYLNVT
jgi:hypothetical protein